MKNDFVIGLGILIVLFGLTRIGTAADSRDNNASVSNLLESNSGRDSFFRVTYPRGARSNAGGESSEDSKRTLERYKWTTPGNSEYDHKDRLNPVTLYNW